jgi:photosystem II stability/assembly factor-like uncharacterized protein
MNSRHHFVTSILRSMSFASILFLATCTKREAPLDVHFVDIEVVRTFGFVDEIHFVDDQYGLLTCNNSQVWVTSNGGRTWTTRFTSLDNEFFDVSYPSRDTIYVFNEGNSGNCIYRSFDRGVNWSQVSAGQLVDGTEISFFSGLYGIASSQGFKRTFDGGVTWLPLTSGPQIVEIECRDDPYAFARSSVGSVMRSTNAGASWSIVGNNIDCADWCFEENLWSAFHADHNGKIFRSGDYGATWSLVMEDPKRPYFRSIDSDASGLVIAVGSGVIIISKDFGTTWNYYIPEGATDIEEYSFDHILIIDADHILISGQAPGRGAQGFVGFLKIK